MESQGTVRSFAPIYPDDALKQKKNIFGLYQVLIASCGPDDYVKSLHKKLLKNKYYLTPKMSQKNVFQTIIEYDSEDELDEEFNE